MTTLLAHVFSIAAILAAAWFLLYRPVRDLLRTEARKIDERVKEMETLAAAVKAADAERGRALKEIGETMDRIRAATSDLMRQESKRIIERGIAELEEARDKARETWKV